MHLSGWEFSPVVMLVTKIQGHSSDNQEIRILTPTEYHFNLMISSPYFCTLTLENTKLQPGTWSSSSSSLYWRIQLSWPTYTCTWCTTACLISQHCVQATNLFKSFLLPLKVNHKFEQRSSENFAKLSALAQLVFYNGYYNTKPTFWVPNVPPPSA